jgi:hypothetical protein
MVSRSAVFEFRGRFGGRAAKQHDLDTNAGVPLRIGAIPPYLRIRCPLSLFSGLARACRHLSVLLHRQRLQDFPIPGPRGFAHLGEALQNA